nr:MAG TPA: hypothetical protein [Caudoviricetes sp.]
MSQTTHFSSYLVKIHIHHSDLLVFICVRTTTPMNYEFKQNYNFL